MDRINQSKTAVLLAGFLSLSGLGAGEPATQPGKPDSISGKPMSEVQPTSSERGSRRSRSNRGSGSTNGEPSNAAAMPGSGNDPYAAVQSRSIFVKGNQTVASNSGPVRPAFTPTSPLQNAPESSLVFNGVIIVSSEPNALIENRGSNNVSLVPVGDMIAVGKVSAITFDDLTYEANGQQKHVAIGQNLLGVVPPSVAVLVPSSPPSTMPAAGPVGVSPPTGGPGPGVTPPPAGGGSSPEDILARLKAKRNQELGIK